MERRGVGGTGGFGDIWGERKEGSDCDTCGVMRCWMIRGLSGC